MWDLLIVPQPGIEPQPLALGARSLSQWTREVPFGCFKSPSLWCFDMTALESKKYLPSSGRTKTWVWDKKALPWWLKWQRIFPQYGRPEFNPWDKKMQRERNKKSWANVQGLPGLEGWAFLNSFKKMKKWPVLLCSCGGKTEQEGHLYCWPGVIKIISKLPQGASGRWFRCRLCSAWKRTKRPASLPMHHFRRKWLCLWADITLNCSPQHRTSFLHRGHPYLARRGHAQVRDEGHAGPLKWTWQFRPGSKAEGQPVSPQGTRKPCHATSQKWAFVQEVQGMQGTDLTVRSCRALWAGAHLGKENSALFSKCI